MDVEKKKESGFHLLHVQKILRLAEKKMVLLSFVPFLGYKPTEKSVLTDPMSFRTSLPVFGASLALSSFKLRRAMDNSSFGRSCEKNKQHKLVI